MYIYLSLDKNRVFINTHFQRQDFRDHYHSSHNVWCCSVHGVQQVRQFVLGILRIIGTFVQLSQETKFPPCIVSQERIERPGCSSAPGWHARGSWVACTSLWSIPSLESKGEER